MTHNMRALFFPWGWGGAVAYTARCLAVADRLRAAGWQVAFADSGASNIVRDAGIEVLPQSGSEARDLSHRRLPAFLPFGNVERVFAVAARYYDWSRLRSQYSDDARNVESFKPNLVVVDMAPTAAVAARAAGLPVLSIADPDFLSTRDNAWMPWLTVPANRLLPHPSCLPAFNTLLREVGLEDVQAVRDLLWGDHTLVCSVPELEPPEDDWLTDRLTYCGPLSWEPPLESPIDLPSGDRPRIYISIGSGATVPREVLQTVVDVAAAVAPTVLVSKGFAFEGALRHPSHVHVVGFTGLERPLGWADVVVSHGGAGTVMATLLHGKPSLIIPSTSEQEMNGRVLVEGPGAGLLLRRSEVDPVTARLSYRYRVSRPSSAAEVHADDVHEALALLLDDIRYMQAARRVSKSLQQAHEGTDVVAIAEALATGAAPH